MNRLRLRKAFTVVEMVIVIAVIAILSAVLIPTISGVIQKANVSADQQFAASLNIQLALWEVDNGEIDNESDLRDAINEFYGEKDEEGKLLSGYTLEPKSGKNGYHFWYDVENKQVVVSTYEGFLPKDENEGVPADVGMLTFSPASLRSLLINTKEGEKNYYLMDQAGDELVNLLVAFENLGDDSKVGSNSDDPAQQYEYTINQLKGIAETGSLAEILLNKVQITTIVTGEGAYRFNDVNAIKHVYVPLSATVINVQNVYEYTPGADGADGTVTTSDNFKLALPENVHVVQIPVGVKIATNGFPAMSECTNPGVDGNWEEATVLEILASSMSQLTDADGNFMFDVQTSNPVFKLLVSGLFFMEDDQVYNLPYTDGDTAVEIGGTVGTGTTGNLAVEVSFPDAEPNAGEGTHYYDSVNKILYAQYDQTSIRMNVKNGTYVNWEYSPASSAGLITVSGNTLTINDADSSTVEHDKIKLSDNNQIKVTGSVNGVEKVSFTVCLIMPREISVGDYTSTLDAVGVVGARPIEIVYDGNNDSFTFDFGVNHGEGQNSKVATWAVSVSSGNGKFTPSLNTDNTKLTIALEADTYTFEDVLNVTVGSETFSFTVKCTDTSGAAFDNALFYDDPSTDEYVQGKDVKIGEKYLFRVGNKNSITLGQLFTTEKAYADVAFKLYDYSYSGRPLIGSNSAQEVTLSSTAQFVEVKDKDTNEITERYWTVPGADWEDLTLRFHNTGVVKISIGSMQSGAYVEDKYVLLEVVDGTNINTDDYNQMESATNPVLWHDVTMPTGDYQYTLKNATLYGNGYKFDVSGGRTKGTKAGENYLVGLNSGTLDNVKIVGAVYTSINITASQEFNCATVVLTGNSGIYNSYISNCMSPVRVVNGNAVIENSTLKGGAYANLDIRGGNTTLRNVTTINQVESNDKASNGTTPIGLGIVVWYDSTPDETKLIIDGELHQYNYVSKAQAGKITPFIVSGIDLVSKFVDEVFGQNLSEFQYEDGSTTWVNTGILSMSDKFDRSDILKPSGEAYTPVNYKGASVTASTYNGYMCTMTGDKVQNDVQVGLDKSAPEWQPTAQKAIAPTHSFDYTSKNNIPQKPDSNDYCYHDTTSGQVLISMDKGDTFNWDTSILTAKKDGNTLRYTVSMNGKDYTGKSIAFDTSGEYTVVYTYTDSKNYDKDGNSYEVTYSHQVKISVSVVEAHAKNAEFSFNGTTGNKEFGSDNKWYVSADVSETNSSWGSMNVGGKTIYYPIVNATPTKNFAGEYQAFFPVFKDIISITDYENAGLGDPVIYKDNGKNTDMPSGLTVVKGFEGYQTYTGDENFANVNDSSLNKQGAAKVFKWQATADASATPKYQNSVFSYASPSGLPRSGNHYWIVQYSYKDNVGTTFYYYVGYVLKLDGSGDSGGGGGTCIAEGTMITLADGSKKAVEDLRKGDMVMSFDHLTGEITYKDVIIVVRTSADSYYKNTFVFDDGTELLTINEHGIFDLDLNKYVNIDHINYIEYLGHSFVSVDSEGNLGVKKLVDVKTVVEGGYKYDIVTNGTLNYVAEDTLSVTHVLVDVINSFDFGAGLKYDAEKMQADIEKYGLYDYAEWEEYCDISVFDQYNIPVMKVGISKGLYTKEYIIGLINTYVLDDSVQIID